MQPTDMTYPEASPPSWGIVCPFSFHTIQAFLRKGLTGPAHSPRTRAYKATLDAVHQLHGRGVEEFRGDKVLRLLIAAAREHGWMRRKGSPYKAKPKAKQPDHKVCRRCEQEKPMAEFRTLATLAQKRRNGWPEDSQHFTYAVTCAPCRKLKQQAQSRKETKRRDPDTYTAYRTTFYNEVKAVDTIFRNHIAFTTPDGDRVYQFADEADQSYYAERRRLLLLARQRFEDAANDGTLFDILDPDTPKGAWYGLLTPDERAKLAYLHKQGSWMSSSANGRMPTLWERKVIPRRRLKTSIMDEPTPTVEPPPEVLFKVTPVSDPSKFDPELGF